MLVSKFTQLLQNITGKSISTTPKTLGGVMDDYNNLYTCAVTFATTLSGATIVVKQGTTVISAVEGVYYLKEGNYTYDASADGYVTKTAQALAISNSDETIGAKEVTVTLTKYCVVTFAPKDSVRGDPITGATIVVYNDTPAEVDAEADGTYNLIAGSYTYDISAEGYTSQTAQALVISAGDVTTGTKTEAPELVASAG